MKKILVFLPLIILLVSCVDEVLSPDIEIVSISPLGYYITDDITSIAVDEVVLTARNSQDAHIIGFIWEFYDFNENLIYEAPEPFPLSVAVKGLVDPNAPETTYIYDLLVQTDTLAAYLVHNDLWSAKIKYRFIAEADYFPGHMDTADIYIGLYRFKIIYIVDVTADNDSIPRDGVSSTRITATLQGAGDHPVSGTMVQFLTTLGHVEPEYAITNTEGKASVYLFSDQGTVAAFAYVSASHTYATGSPQAQVKFYIPQESTFVNVKVKNLGK